MNSEDFSKKVRDVRCQSIAEAARETLGEDMYRYLTRDKEYISVNRKLSLNIVYISGCELKTSMYDFPAHLLNTDDWTYWLANSFAAQTEGCDYVLGAISGSLDLHWHTEVFAAMQNQ